jgi:hypothetical protein
MALDALAKSRLKAETQADRDDLADRHRSEKQQLTKMQDDRDKREREQARKNGQSYDSTKRRVAEKAEQAAWHKSEYDAMNKRHAKLMESAEKKGAVPAGHGVSRTGAKLNQEGLTPKERGEYNGIVRHFSNQHARTHNADEAKKDRLSRYKSSAMTAKMEEARLTHHNDVSRKAEQSLANLRRKVEARKGAA